MIYLSLDQALKTTGWAVFNNNNLVAFGTFNIPSAKPIEYRLNAMMKELCTLENTYNIEKIFFEDIQNQNNNETFKKLAYIQAAILIWCYSVNKPYAILSPSHWRKVLKDKYNISFGKNRQEQKAQAINFINDHYQLNVDSDTADAICLGIAGLIEENNNKNINTSAW
jgi:Holliday junction resolvasome RuvABC endonuclease subunit